jgi:cystathionine beta-synthase
MKQFDQTVLDVVGNTPIIKLSSRTTNVDSEIYAKLEFLNPGGSIKDRIGTYMLEQAIERGDLRPGGTIIEGTSGNTGVGLAMFAALHGYKTIFVLADKQSPEKNPKSQGVRCQSDRVPNQCGTGRSPILL